MTGHHRRNVPSAATAVVLVLGHVACADPLPPPSLVESLRVLAVRATPPVAAPGAEVALDVLIADPEGDDRELAIEWAGCLAPADADPVRCFDEARASRLGSGPAARVTIPSDALATEPEAVFGVAVLVCTGGRIEWGPARPTCIGGQEEILSTKRILVAAEPADNPAVSFVAFGGVVAIDGELLRLDPCGFRCGPTRVSLNVNGPAPEGLWTAFAATRGDFDEPFVDGTAPTTLWDAPDGGGPVRFYFVVRDDEGGVDWAIRDVEVASRTSR